MKPEEIDLDRRHFIYGLGTLAASGGLASIVNVPGILGGTNAVDDQAVFDYLGGPLQRVINYKAQQLRTLLARMQADTIALREVEYFVERAREAHFEASDALHDAQAKLYASLTEFKSRRADDPRSPKVELMEEVALMGRRTALEAIAVELKMFEARQRDLLESLAHVRETASWSSKYLKLVLDEAGFLLLTGEVGGSLAATVFEARMLLVAAAMDEMEIEEPLNVRTPILARQQPNRPFPVS